MKIGDGEARGGLGLSRNCSSGGLGGGYFGAGGETPAAAVVGIVKK